MTSDPTSDTPDPTPDLTSAEEPEEGEEGEVAEAPDAPEVQLTRRERRARSRGPAAKVLGPAAGRNTPMPTKGRDYAHRRRG